MTKVQSGAAKRIQIVNEIANYMRQYPLIPPSEMIDFIIEDYGAVPSKAREYYLAARCALKNRGRPRINPEHIIEASEAEYRTLETAAAITDGLEKRGRHKAPKPDPEAAPDTGIWINPEARKRKPKCKVGVQKDLTLSTRDSEKKPTRSMKGESKKKGVKE